MKPTPVVRAMKTVSTWKLSVAMVAGTLKQRDTDKFDFEVHCSEGEIVVRAGRASCVNGELGAYFPKCALKQNGTNVFIHDVHCLHGQKLVEYGLATCENGDLFVTQPTCESNFKTPLVINKYFIILTALLGCAFLIYTIYVTIRKVQKYRMALPRADDEEVLYDEIDLRYAVEPPVPEPPPRVHDGHGYLLVKEPYQYDVVGEEKTLENWMKTMPKVSDDVEQDDVDDDRLSHNVEVPEDEVLLVHNPEMPENVDEDQVSRQLEESDYVDHNDLHRYENKMRNRPKLPEYVDQNDFEKYSVKLSHNQRVFKDVHQNNVVQNRDKVIRNLEDTVTVDQPVDQSEFHLNRVQLSHKQESSDDEEQNADEQITHQISHKPKVSDDDDQNTTRILTHGSDVSHGKLRYILGLNSPEALARKDMFETARQMNAFRRFPQPLLLFHVS
ncbi:hypothetical protein B566_EDAN011028 [Ephemera danica]|nr:hypothetical protein B566_EDAN011028 [Ephemera danica]